MRSTKYYYSKPAYVKYMRTLLDGQGKVCYISEKFDYKKAKRIPRVCVASVWDKDTRIMQFGVAVCSPKDNYKKAIGRQLAYTRALAQPAKRVVLRLKANVRKVSVKYANELIDKYLERYV